ncbi:butyrophilin-like protein 8 [Carcharodon carcharias]|uniref:butyrophilin-like protein 8 n=1 Tax=Carcharodon carcharias TaxID=13397 RepID=UPI001B7F6875|nr:butyrophilin-like protein 8 [Carcharodon carcharias]XP_041030678.1 butyrophilin-like protein 8 [Carcharodon carcharias]XP_041030681.1 butyrophilin-like protein 8 [Carcharodon carcharias]XP_041030691.1 butyrophilin-like protein 8 [Carcharodon carcharias]
MSRLFVSLVHFIIILAAAQGFTDGDLKVNCLEDEITVKAGEDLVISCHYHPADEPSAIAFNWMKMETMGIIYNYTVSHSSVGEQNPSYQDRAEVCDNEIPKGNVSLKLKNVTLSDSGIYRLSVTNQSQSHEIMVTVGVRAVGEQPVIHSYVTDQGVPMLVCESSGWFPEPTVLWENGHGMQLTKNAQTERINSTDGIIHMRSTIRLDHGSVSNYTCTMMDQHLGEVVSFVFVVLIAGSPWNIVIGTAGTIVFSVILAVSIYWSW